MRSRFSAYALGEVGYLLSSWHPSTRPASLELDPEMRWYRLDILGRGRGGPLDSEGTVDFAAFFRSDAGPGEQREHSRFVRQGGQWLYVDGDALN